MATSTCNPLGAVMIADGGIPQIITVKAVTNISGGYWVTGSGVAGAAKLSSGTNSYAASDIEGWTMTATVTSSGVMGIALQDIASGTYGPCATNGTFILPAGSATAIGSVVKGCPIAAYGLGGVIGSITLSHNCIIGKALTDGGGGDDDEQWVAVKLNI